MKIRNLTKIAIISVSLILPPCLFAKETTFKEKLAAHYTENRTAYKIIGGVAVSGVVLWVLIRLLSREGKPITRMVPATLPNTAPEQTKIKPSAGPEVSEEDESSESEHPLRPVPPTAGDRNDKLPVVFVQIPPHSPLPASKGVLSPGTLKKGILKPPSPSPVSSSPVSPSPGMRTRKVSFGDARFAINMQVAPEKVQEAVKEQSEQKIAHEKENNILSIDEAKKLVTLDDIEELEEEEDDDYE